MQRQQQDQRVEQVAASTVAAVHRRDHDHGQARECHPHAVEVVHLGHRAVTVCHDCQADSGFVPERQAETLARQHLEQTLGEASVPLSAAVA